MATGRLRWARSSCLTYSSADKAWVRRFERRLREGGYNTWLDEKEIEVGDALAAKISQGLRDASSDILLKPDC